MSSNPSTPLRASERKAKLRDKLRRQARLRSSILLVIILATWLIDRFVFSSGLAITKGVAIGAVLNWLTQALFALFVFRFIGAKARHAIVNQMYLGQMLKWAVTIFGFAVIFSSMTSVSVAAVLVGYVVMQLGNFVSLWHIR